MKTKPFNLQALKNGEPVITRDGYKVQILHISDMPFKHGGMDGHRIAGLVENTLVTWREHGNILCLHKHPLDLFHPVKKNYINLYGESAPFSDGIIYTSIEEARALNKAQFGVMGKYLGVFEIIPVGVKDH